MNITGGVYNSLKVKAANLSNIKPTLSKIRQAVFNSISSQSEKYKTFCDLFSGSGIITFEAISRGYEVTSIEIDKKSVQMIKYNSENLKIPINIICNDAIKFLNVTEQTFDIFYLDPPYNSNLYNIALKIIHKRNLLNDDGIIVLEKPITVEVETNSYNNIKNKKYSDKEICFLKKV